MSYFATIRALSAPKRAVPLAGVAFALVASEWSASGSWVACGIDLSLVLTFCAVSPASWRVAAARAQDPAAGWLPYAVFALLGTAVVSLVGLLPVGFGLRGTYVVDPSAMGLLLVLFLVGGWGLGRDIDLEEGIESAERRADRLGLDAERARVVAMRAQLDPHFLFNTLNAIAEWCREDPALAEQATLKLASMLRAILDGSSRPSWPLVREVALMEQLVELYTVRDREKYRFALDVPRPPPDVEVPPMLFLPLIENAITHGPAVGNAGEIRITLRTKPDSVELEITNPGAYTGRRVGGQGIAMVERRLALAYGGAARLSIRADAKSTITLVSIPLAPMASEAVS